MAGEWREVRLREVATLITKGTTPTTLGMSFAPSGVNYIKAESVTNDGTIDRSKFAFIDSATHAALKRSQIEAGDLLMSMAGVYLGKVAVVPPEVTPANTNQAVAIIRLISEVANQRFVAYYMRNTEYNIFINSLVAQSAQPNLNLSEIGNLPLRLPPIDDQRAIAHILGTMDDKIELNRRMNETLEEMARALFKSWFVDFDPVRAKIEGRDTGLPREIADLFPDSFEDSELGEVPKGWRICPLYDTASFINGAAFKNEDFCESSEGLPVIKIAELKNGISSQTKFSCRVADDSQRIDTGDLLYSWSGSPDTSLDAFLWTGGPGLLNQHIFKIAASSTAHKRLVYYLLKHLRPVLVETAKNKQTTGLGHVTVADMKRLFICWPHPSVLSVFDQRVAPLFDRAFLGTLESRTLAAQREALLPKLLSGEIRLNKLI